MEKLNINSKIESQISFHKFNPDTFKIFQLLKNQLETSKTNDLVSQIEHVGSTAIGIDGKNTIDILIITEKENFDKVEFLLKKLNLTKEIIKTKRTTILYEGSSLFNDKSYNINIHIANTAMPVSKRIIYFRDYMLKDKTLRDEYVNVKTPHPPLLNTSGI